MKIPPPGRPPVGGPGQGQRSPVPSLSVGDTITARVVAGKAPGLFLLQTETGATLTARSDTALPVGDVVTLTVRQAGPLPVLTPTASSNQAAVGAMLRFLDLGPGPSLPDSIAALQSFFTGSQEETLLDRLAAAISPMRLGAAPDVTPLVQALMTLRSRQGSLRNLLPKLERLPGALRKKAPRHLQADLDRLERFLRLETLLAAQEPPWLLLPLFFDDGGQGYMIAEGDTPPRETTIALFLDLTRLGPLRATITLSERKIQATIVTATPAARDHLAGGGAELHSRLEHLGLGTVAIRIESGPVNLPADVKRLIEEKLAASPLSLVDVTV